MYGFLVKKAFFDMWDHMLTIFLLNFGFILALGLALYLPFLLSFNTTLSIFGLALGIFAFNYYSAAASLVASSIADYQSTEFKAFFRSFKEVWKPALVFSAIMFFQVFVFIIVFPFYTQMGGLLGLAAMALLFWVSLIWWLSAQYFYPLYTKMDKDLKKVLKKCFIMFFDNTFFSIVLGVGTVAITVVSGFTAFLLPGIASVLLWHQAGFKLRLYKYDYLEEHPEADKKKIPWAALLIDDKDRVGQRTLRGMIFPWKE